MSANPPTNQEVAASSATPPDDIEPLVRELEELLAREGAKISDLLLAAHRLAKRREDAAFLKWVECEIDGYSETDVADVPEEHTRYRLIRGFFLMTFGPAGQQDVERLPYPFFEAKGAPAIDEMLRAVPPGVQPSRIIPTPTSVREFFTRHLTNTNVPPVLTLYVEVEEYSKILQGVRRRFRDYLRSLR